jgi:phosphosulfolactate synthase (CoM biosynthesis protein A)
MKVERKGDKMSDKFWESEERKQAQLEWLEKNFGENREFPRVDLDEARKLDTIRESIENQHLG